jgi:hypothetical protein
MSKRLLVGGVVGLLVCQSLAGHAADPSLRCQEKKAKASAKMARDVLKAFGNYVATLNISRLAQSNAKARSRLTRAFSKAEAGGTCLTVGDAAAIASKVDAFAQEMLDTYDITRPTGVEFQVNTYTTGNQDFADVASDAQGNFVVVWDGAVESNVSGQRYDSAGEAIGDEFQVNTYTTGGQAQAAIASAPDGRFVVVWWGQHGGAQDPANVFGRRYDSAGTPIGNEFLVNTYLTGNQDFPQVAVAADGRFVVVWSSVSQDGSFEGVFGQRFDSNGVALGPEFQVNVFTNGSQWAQKVASDASGNFVVVWSSRQDGSLQAVMARRYDGTGAPLTGEFLVNTYTTRAQVARAVEADSSGNFVVLWESRQQDGDGWGIFAQRYDSTGVPVGGEVQVNTTTTGDQRSGDLALAENGSVVAVWQSDVGESGIGIFGQRFDSTGAPAGAEFQVNSYTPSDQLGAAVAGDPEEGFVVVWQSEGQDGAGDGVFGQRFVVP